MAPLRLLLIAVASVVIGATIAAHPAPADDVCAAFGTREAIAWTTELRTWPYGRACEYSDGTSQFLGTSAAETLLVTAAVLALLLVAARRWPAPASRALASSLALLGLIGLFAHALGYPGLPVLVAMFAWPLAFAVQREGFPSLVVTACVVPVWLAFDLAGFDWIGIPLAVALATLTAPRVSAWAAGLAATPAPRR